MVADLKAENIPKTYALLASSILACVALQIGFDSLPRLVELAAGGAASALVPGVLVMLTNLVPHDFKHKLVFTRFVDEMPGGRIHQLCRNDPRVEYEKVAAKWPDVFTEDIDQATRNSRWYQQIYKPVKENNEVRQSHRNFLLYRDVFSGFVVLLVFTACWHFFGQADLFGEIVPSVFWVLGISGLLSLVTARNSGNRFVVNAVAAAL